MPIDPPSRLRLFAQQLRQLQRPLVQEADLAVCFMLALAEAGDLPEEPEPAELRRDFRKFRENLLDYGGLERFEEKGKAHGYLMGVAAMPEAEEAICSLDPFAYISHLSAMAWHGLTNRLPKTLFLSCPSPRLWRILSEERLKSQLKAWYPVYRQTKLPLYRRTSLQRLQGRPLNVWSSSRLDGAYQAAFKRVEGGSRRVATLGRCFLDMVRSPDLCGGIYHVVEVFESEGPSHADAIIAELNQHGNKLERARAGYLLESADPELAKHPTLELWASEATRGGSRKLDPTADYADTYSERWALSINV